MCIYIYIMCVYIYAVCIYIYIIIYRYMTGWWSQPLLKMLVTQDYWSQHFEKHVPKHQPDNEQCIFWQLMTCNV